MKNAPSPGQTRHARIVDLPRPEHPARLCLMEADRLLLLELQTALPEHCALGDLVAFRTHADGRVSEIERVGGPAPGSWDEGGDALRWRKPGQAASRMAFLRLRARILSEVRGYFAEEGFLEVDTPVLVPAPTPEPQFTPIAAGGSYLITSPEFQLKRMLVGGFEKIYRIGPVFRGGEAGGHHNPEFTMLEWYRTHQDLEAMAADLEGLLGRLAPLARQGTASPAAQVPAPPGNAALAPALARRPFPRATIVELFRRHLKMDMGGVTTVAALCRAALAAGVKEARELPDNFEQAFFALWDRIEAKLGTEPLLVCEWPAPLASLARLKADDPSVAERMELYAGGLELANGFAELTDPTEQRRRFESDLAARAAQGLPALPLDERFLAALEQGMPPAAGMALGMERLVMLIGGADHIRQVLPFAADEL